MYKCKNYIRAFPGLSTTGSLLGGPATHTIWKFSYVQLQMQKLYTRFSWFIYCTNSRSLFLVYLLYESFPVQTPVVFGITLVIVCLKLAELRKPILWKPDNARILHSGRLVKAFKKCVRWSAAGVQIWVKFSYAYWFYTWLIDWSISFD